MKKINPINFHFFKNNEHAQFHSDVKSEIALITPQKLGISAIYSGYVDALYAEFAAIEVEAGSQLTKTIEDHDDFRDQLYKSFVHKTKSDLLHYDVQVQLAATKIMRIIEQVGDMRKQNYNQESETITSLVNQLLNNYSPELTLCSSMDLVNKLAETNTGFINQFGSRSTEAAARLSGDVRATRAPVDKAFNDIRTVVNAMVILNGEADYASFIDEVNYLIEYYKNTIKVRKARKSANPAPESGTPAV